MAEYIEKSAIMNLIESEARRWGDDYDWWQCLADIEDFKPADVRPVVRGKWVWRHRHRGGFRRVSGEDDFGVRHTITVDERYAIDDPYCPYCGKLNESVFLNFCPNCGADMRETKE